MTQNLPSAVDSYQPFCKFLVDLELACKSQSSQISQLGPNFSHTNRSKAPQLFLNQLYFGSSLCVSLSSLESHRHVDYVHSCCIVLLSTSLFYNVVKSWLELNQNCCWNWLEVIKSCLLFNFMFSELRCFLNCNVGCGCEYRVLFWPTLNNILEKWTKSSQFGQISSEVSTHLRTKIWKTIRYSSYTYNLPDYELIRLLHKKQL